MNLTNPASTPAEALALATRCLGHVRRHLRRMRGPAGPDRDGVACARHFLREARRQMRRFGVLSARAEVARGASR